MTTVGKLSKTFLSIFSHYSHFVHVEFFLKVNIQWSLQVSNKVNTSQVFPIVPILVFQRFCNVNSKIYPFNKKAFQQDAYRPHAGCTYSNNNRTSALVRRGGPRVNKFEQVSSLGHLMSLASGALHGGGTL